MVGTFISLLQARHGGSKKDREKRMDRGPAFMGFRAEQFTRHFTFTLCNLVATW